MADQKRIRVPSKLRQKLLPFELGPTQSQPEHARNENGISATNFGLLL